MVGQRKQLWLLFCCCCCCCCLLRSLEANDWNAWEDRMRDSKADKGCFGPEDEPLAGDLGTDHERQLAMTMLKAPQIGVRTYITERVKQGLYNSSSVLVDADHALWETERVDPARIRRRRCRTTRGDWCGQFDRQIALPFKPPPRGSKACRNNCNNVGNCNFDIGYCDCPAGWSGDDCTTRQLRPCTHRRERPPGSLEPSSHIDADGRDKNWHTPGWTASRCAGICEAEIGMCWCDGENKNLSWTPAPQGSPPGTPPIRHGRPLSEYCGKVKSDKDGRKTTWGNVPYDTVYGPNGWCNAPRGERCNGCMIDGLMGDYCDEVVEMYCPNQCSGQGECNLGFCKCNPGWYGLDCSRKSVVAVNTPPDALSGKKPWLLGSGFGVPPQAAMEDGDPGLDGDLAKERLQGRKRPLIFVYDIPPAYTTRMLQYRLNGKACIWRRFESGNTSSTIDWIYGIESYFHETLLASSHRTYDPEEADFFYVPVYMTCFFWPVLGYADYPYWYAPSGGPRPMHGANMLTEILDWMKTKYPFWNKTQGRDHIWIQAHDEGACWMPTEIYKHSIVLLHWGRLDLQHKSNTGYVADNYSWSDVFLGPLNVYQPTDWTNQIRGHACYTPGKDLVIPSYKPASHFSSSPLMGAEPMHRDVLLFFRGDVGTRRTKVYSRGIRQQIYKLSQQQDWKNNQTIIIQEQSGGGTPPYSEMLARSVFCLVAPGDGWSARAEDAVLHGCIPVVIMDNVHSVFESILDWDSFSIRIKESSIPHIPEVLASIPATKVARMQRRLVQVWHRFAYMTGKLMREKGESVMHRNKKDFPPEWSKLPASYPIQRVKQFPVEDDAFSTIMQWLYSKVHGKVKGADRQKEPHHLG